MIDSKKLEKFRRINTVSFSGGIVFVGSDCFAELPISELASGFKLDENIYNRSINGATVSDISRALNECVFDLRPTKVFFNLGEIEAENGISEKEFISSYEWLLYTVHGNCSAEIYVVSIEEKSLLHSRYNEAIKALCDETGCKFIDITTAFGGTNTELKVFDALKLHILRNLDFTEMMTML